MFLQTKNLQIGYSNIKKQAVLSNLNLSAKKGEIIGLLGPNGSGKSTLLKTFIKLLTPLGGSVYINKKDVNYYLREEYAKTISFVSTEIIRVPNMTVFDLVSLGRFPYTNWAGKLSPVDKNIIEESIQLVNLEHLKNKNIIEISDGERQRAMIARTLAQDTNMIILDEPTAFLDLIHRYQLINLLKQLSHNQNKTIIFSTHDLNIAIREVDKIWLAGDHTIIEGAPEDLILNDSFKKVFNHSSIIFDKSTGDFEFKHKKTKTINLLFDNEIEKATQFWICKAFDRAGFYLSDTSDMKIIVQNPNSLVLDKTNLKFNTIYEILNYLKNKK